MSAILNFNPPVIAHRGASAYAPENTMIAFTKAMQLGLKWIEFDVMQAACGEPIIFHDELLDRTTNGRGEVHHYPYAYLRTLDAGSWFDPFFAGETIPSFKQLLAFLEWNQATLNLNIEIKALPETEEQLIIRVLEEVSASAISKKINILFSSFSFQALHILRHYAPESQLGMLLYQWEPGWQSLCDSLNCVSVHVDQEIMTASAATEIKSMDKQLLCYTVNEPKTALKLYDWGVDAVFSDVPDTILAALDE